MAGTREEAITEVVVDTTREEATTEAVVDTTRVEATTEAVDTTRAVAITEAVGDTTRVVAMEAVALMDGVADTAAKLVRPRRLRTRNIIHSFMLHACVHES